MIDSRDIKTVDAFPVKKRGRPSTGTAKTSAERMAEKRERDRLAVHCARIPSDYASLSTTALLEGLAEAVSQQQQPTVKKIAAELVKRSAPD